MKIGKQMFLMAHLLAGSASSECPDMGVIEEHVKHTVGNKALIIKDHFCPFYFSRTVIIWSRVFNVISIMRRVSTGKKILV